MKQKSESKEENSVSSKAGIFCAVVFCSRRIQLSKIQEPEQVFWEKL